MQMYRDSRDLRLQGKTYLALTYFRPHSFSLSFSQRVSPNGPKHTDCSILTIPLLPQSLAHTGPEQTASMPLPAANPREADRVARHIQSPDQWARQTNRWRAEGKGSMQGAGSPSHSPSAWVRWERERPGCKALIRC